MRRLLAEQASCFANRRRSETICIEGNGVLNVAKANLFGGYSTAFKITGVAIGADGPLTVGVPEPCAGGFNGGVEVRGSATVGGAYDLPESRAAACIQRALLSIYYCKDG